MLYMTPERFRVAGTGIDLSGLEDVELVSVLSRATSMVNSYTAAPRLPQAHNFAGGSITGERQRWHLGSEVVPSSRRFYPWHGPISEVSRFRILASEGTYIEIDPDNLFVNRDEGYVEVVALAMGIGVYPVVANLAMAQPVAEMDYTYQYQFAVTGETLYETDNDVFRSQHQYWAAEPAPVIYKDGVAQPSGFTIDSVEGTVTFSSSLSASEVVTADYTYTLPDDIANATAIIATSQLSETNLIAKGMGGLLEIQVAEVRLRRPTPTALLTRETPPIPREAITLLDPYVFRSVG